MVALAAALAAIVLVAAAETWHARRVRRVAQLAFGPTRRPRAWARLAPAARGAAAGAVTWGLATLATIEPKVHRVESLDKNQLRHLVLVLDVSPSMRLADAGPGGKQARLKRVADLLDSFFERSPEPFRTSVVAFYNGAKPVVVDTTDLEVIHNILGDLPMNYAFEVGQTKLFDGLEEAAKLARPWEPKSATLVVLSDGDTVPATGIPKLPASIFGVLVVGVGDPRSGSFIDGRQSRQDASTLRQVAVRLGGTYHNGNEKQIPTDVLRSVVQQIDESPFERLTRREYALLACALGAAALAGLPALLSAFGTRWRPGVPAPSQSAAPPIRREIDTPLAGSVR
jgi:Ca-activated chloride channel family protein